MHTVLYPVSDLAKAKEVYTALLATAPTADSPYYVGFDADDLHVGLVPGGHGPSAPTVHWHVSGIADAVRRLVEAGATELQAPREVGGGRLVAVLADPDGNPLGLIEDPAR